MVMEESIFNNKNKSFKIITHHIYSDNCLGKIYHQQLVKNVNSLKCQMDNDGDVIMEESVNEEYNEFFDIFDMNSDDEPELIVDISASIEELFPTSPIPYIVKVYDGEISMNYFTGHIIEQNLYI
jgi:hypothetical protein